MSTVHPPTPALFPDAQIKEMYDNPVYKPETPNPYHQEHPLTITLPEKVYVTPYQTTKPIYTTPSHSNSISKTRLATFPPRHQAAPTVPAKDHCQINSFIASQSTQQPAKQPRFSRLTVTDRSNSPSTRPTRSYLSAKFLNEFWGPPAVQSSEPNGLLAILNSTGRGGVGNMKAPKPQNVKAPKPQRKLSVNIPAPRVSECETEEQKAWNELMSEEVGRWMVGEEMRIFGRRLHGGKVDVRG